MGEISAHFFGVAKKAAPGRIYISSPLARVFTKASNKSASFFGTGSRRGVTPGHMGAQNRWLLKGVFLEESLHRTGGRDRPGALAMRRAAAQLMMMMMMKMMMMMALPRLFIPPPIDIA